MNRREHQPFIIAIRRFDIHRTPVRRFQRQIGKKFIDAMVPFGNRMEMVEIPRALRVIVVLVLEDREIVLVDMVYLIRRLPIV